MAPIVTSVNFTPATISLGENLGMRATLSVSFRDIPHSDTGFDKYLADRTYDPFRQGTFWGKFRARNPFVRGRSIRLIRGQLGQTLEQMDTRHYVLESFDGPTPDGRFTLTAKDVLKLADNDRALAPRPSTGALNATINSAVTSATLTPSGIGNLEYPASGHLNIGGKEIVSFTRSGDVCTITRGQLNTTAVAHEGGERAQLVLEYVGEDGADILADYFETYAGIDSAFIPLSSWQAETAAYLQRVYTVYIAEPTGVNKLASELIEQMASALWWDDSSQLIRLQVLRAVSTDAYTFTHENTMGGSLMTMEQPEKRLSQVITWFGQNNPLKSLEDRDNFRSCVVTVAATAETDYGSPAIKEIFSRYIAFGGSTVALRVNQIQLARYVNPPRKFTFDAFRDDPQRVILGAGYQVQGWSLQDATGAAATAPVQVINLLPGPEKFRVEAEEMLFEGIELDDLNDRVIVIDSDINNINLRSIHDTLFPEIADPTGLTVTFIVSEGIKVGSSSNLTPAVDVGSWVAALDITVRVLGRIQGAGGMGAIGGRSDGLFGIPYVAALPGGPALYTRYPISLDMADGEVWGGGGGGSYIQYSGPVYVEGSGGAGKVPGLKGYFPIPGQGFPQQDGTTEAGGVPAYGYAGGDPGEPGDGPTPGAAGAAIDGDSFVTITDAGDLRGTQIN